MLTQPAVPSLGKLGLCSPIQAALEVKDEVLGEDSNEPPDQEAAAVYVYFTKMIPSVRITMMKNSIL